MTTTEIITEIRSLPLACNGAVEKLTPRLEEVSARLAAAGFSVRRGGYNRSGRAGTTYLYATAPGAAEERVFECETTRSGYFTPISGKSFVVALDALESALSTQSPPEPMNTDREIGTIVDGIAAETAKMYGGETPRKSTREIWSASQILFAATELMLGWLCYSGGSAR